MIGLIRDGHELHLRPGMAQLVGFRYRAVSGSLLRLARDLDTDGRVAAGGGRGSGSAADQKGSDTCREGHSTLDHLSHFFLCTQLHIS